MSYKILLIDDSITQLEMLKLQFEKAGFEVETAQNGGKGYQKVFSSAPDLILSDIIMPDLNGYQLCRLLKNNQLTRDLPIILLTVLDKKIDQFWGNKSGADMFISKTATFEEIEQIARMIIKENPVSNAQKEKLVNSKISREGVQNQINLVLGELLMNSTFLNEFRDLSEYLSHEKVLVEKTFELLGSFVDYNMAGLFFNKPDKNEKNVLHLHINKCPVSNFVIEKIKRDFFAQMPGLREFSIRDFGHDIVGDIEDDLIEERIVSFEQIKSTHIIPLFLDGKLLGGICFFNAEKINYQEFDFYHTMINELSLLFKMRYLYSETEYLSVTDGLTGLYNRRHFEYNIEREFLRTKRYSGELSMAMIDIDYFKKVNDTYGHQFGDYVLREIAELLHQSFRKTDMIYRYGGEELSVILTETSMESALIPLGRLRETVANHNFSYNGKEAKVTISIGVSTSFDKIKNQFQLVEHADKALYQAKQEGRNKLVAAVNE